MPEELTWQPWTTLDAAASAADITQPQDNWLDVGEAPSVTVRVDVMYLTGATLAVQIAPAAHGPWSSAASFTSATKSVLITSAEPYSQARNQTQRYVRWFVDAPAGPWNACFRMRASLSDTPGSVVTVDSRTQQLKSSGGSGTFSVTADRTPGIEEVQPWVSLRGGFTPTGGSSDVVMAEDKWLDTSHGKYLVLEAQVLNITGATLVLESAMGAEGPWTSFGTFGSATGYSFQTYALSKEQAATVRLRNLVRWRLEGTTNTWQTCFRLNGTLV